MAKRRINNVYFKEAISAPPILTGENNLSETKQKGIEMELDAGILWVKYKGYEILIPLANIRSMTAVKEVSSQHKLSA